MNIFDVGYEYFWRELLSLIWIMIIFNMDYDDLCRSLFICDV